MRHGPAQTTGAARPPRANRMSSTVPRRLSRIVTGLLAAVLVLFAAAGPAAAATPKFTFVIDPASWTTQEKAQLKSWLSASGPVMTTVQEVVGPPAESITVHVVKASTGFAGDYDSADRQIDLSALSLSVLVHELNHATRDRRILADRVWEEGQARAGEKEEMRLLALKGISEEGYDLNHSYGYDVYYENDNVPDVGVPDGNIYAELGLQLLRYEQAGYAFSKVMIEDPGFLVGFNAKLFAHPDGGLSALELAATAAEVQSTAEGRSTAKWVEEQHIFDTNQAPGCYLFMRTNQYTVDLYCVSQAGGVTMQPEAKITLKVTGPNGEGRFVGKGVTSSYGWVAFSPEAAAATGRLKLVASAKSPDGPVKAISYRQSGDEEGVFGVVTNANSGSVSFSSPSGQLTSLTVPVINGAFVAPPLGSVRGQLVAVYSGEGLTAQRAFNKDAAPYSLVLTATKVRKSR